MAAEQTVIKLQANI